MFFLFIPIIKHFNLTREREKDGDNGDDVSRLTAGEVVIVQELHAFLLGGQLVGVRHEVRVDAATPHVWHFGGRYGHVVGGVTAWNWCWTSST